MSTAHTAPSGRASTHPSPSGRAAAAAPRAPTGPGGLGGHVPLLLREPYEVLVLGLLVVLGLLLNHSSVIFGLNLSLADPVVAVLVAALVLGRRLWMPVAPLVFFLLLSVQLLAVTLWLVPFWTSVQIPAADSIIDFTKLAVSFLCLVLGVQVVRMGRARLVLRAFAIGSVAVSAIAVIAQVITLPGIDALYYGGYRFQGLTNDPNNFAVMTVAAIAVLWYDRGIRLHLQVIGSAILAGGVLLSASKTGAITLALLVIWRTMGLRTPLGEDSDARSRRLLGAVVALGIAMIALLVAPGLGIGSSLAELTSQIPALDRISTLLVSFDSAVAGGGSERSAAWLTAIALILLSPLFGIGLGSYLTVAKDVTEVEVLAHNTYLQIMAEWGLPFALVFLFWAARLVVKRPLSVRLRALWATSSTALLVMLVGSVGLSLNNSRLFWFILGITAATHLLSSKEPEAEPEPEAAPHPTDPAPAPSRRPAGTHLGSFGGAR